MKRIIYAFALAALFAACEKEDDSRATDLEVNTLEQKVDLSNPTIKKYHDNYSCYILNDFDQLADFAYQFDQASTWRSAIIDMLPDADLDGALTFLENNFFKYYPDQMPDKNGTMVNTNFREKYLPLKFLICERITAGTLGITYVPVNELLYHDAAANINSFTVAKLDAESLSNLASEPTWMKEYVDNIHYMFLAGYLASAKGVELANNDFYSISNNVYGTATPTSVKASDYYINGFIAPWDNVFLATYPKRDVDLRQYIDMLLGLTDEQVTTLKDAVAVKEKARYLVASLTALGVDILAYNPKITSLLN